MSPIEGAPPTHKPNVGIKVANCFAVRDFYYYYLFQI